MVIHYWAREQWSWGFRPLMSYATFGTTDRRGGSIGFWKGSE